LSGPRCETTVGSSLALRRGPQGGAASSASGLAGAAASKGSDLGALSPVYKRAAARARLISERGEPAGLVLIAPGQGGAVANAESPREMDQGGAGVKLQQSGGALEYDSSQRAFLEQLLQEESVSVG